MSVAEVVDVLVLMLYAQEGTVPGPRKRQALEMALRYLIRYKEIGEKKDGTG